MSVLEPTSGFDVVHPDTRFPVVESTQLDPLPSRLFRQARRRIDELPQLAGGSVFVFQTNDKFALAPEGPKMLGSDVVVKANMVAVVLMRAHEVPAFATLSATNSGSRLILRASYNCRVLDPVRVLESGCWDVRADLRGYLLRDAKLRMLGAREDAGRNPEVAQRILARMYARNQLEPPVIPGLAVELIDLALNVQHDNGWLPGPRRSPEQAGEFREYGYRTRDSFGDAEDNQPRDRY
ncbi:hypothetical protein AB0K00_39070 [Dactylosporangium sp. NPDC049525]|uniref:hypothetical protein n=1 Tax=Dactylosporangium sp. NPDC049525 TaxID=3154730 RepID=UPI0034251669